MSVYWLYPEDSGAEIEGVTPVLREISVQGGEKHSSNGFYSAGLIIEEKCGWFAL